MTDKTTFSFSDLVLPTDTGPPAQGESTTSSLLGAASLPAGTRDGGDSLSLSLEDNESSIASLGLSTTAPPVTYGPSIAAIRQVSKICCGSIGQGPVFTKFCALSKDECTIAKHERLKVSIMDGFYILDPSNKGKRICFTEPVLSLDVVNPAIEAELLQNSYETDQAIKQFIQIESVNAKQQEETKLLPKEDKKQVITHKTPKKSNTSEPLITANSNKALVDYFNRLTDFDDDELQALRKGLPKLSLEHLVAVLVDNALELPELLRDITSAADMLESKVQEKDSVIDDIVLKLRQLEATLGDSTECVKRGLNPTIWQALTGVLDQIASVKSIADNATTAGNQQRHAHVRLSSDLNTVLSSFRTRIVKLSDRVIALENAGNVPPSGTGLTALHLASSPVAANTAVGMPTSTTLDDMNAVLDAMKLKIEALEEHNRVRDEQGVVESVRFLGHTFVDQNDVELWCTKNGIAPDCIPPFGLFVDPILLYYWVYTRMIGGGTSQSDLATRKKLATNELEVRALESFNYDVPVIFAGESKKTGTS